MATPRSRKVRPGGVARAFGRLVLMVAAGFAAGLVIGVALEEPALLAGHLRGEGETVRLVDAPFAETNQAFEDLGSAETQERTKASPPEQGKDSSIQAQRLALTREGDSAGYALPKVAAEKASPAAPASETNLRTSPITDKSPSRVATATDSARWSIQVGAFEAESAARALVSDLHAGEYPTVIVPTTSGKHRFRVRVQPIRGKVRAQEVANRLKREQGLPTWLIPMGSDGR